MHDLASKAHSPEHSSQPPQNPVSHEHLSAQSAGCVWHHDSHIFRFRTGVDVVDVVGVVDGVVSGCQKGLQKKTYKVHRQIKNNNSGGIMSSNNYTKNKNTRYKLNKPDPSPLYLRTRGTSRI